MKLQTTRREFLKTTTLAGMAGLGFWTSGKSVAAESKSPSEKLNIGIVGAGGKGHDDTNHLRHHNIVALCDVDEKNAGDNLKQTPKAKFYFDFREMLEKEEKNLDAVVVATPDHTHAVASVMAMKMGKAVYCQKPLVHTVYEARMMRETAAKQKVATQMGNQGSAEDGLRRAVEVIQAGKLGPVHEVHVWTNRPIWPQGIPNPLPEEPVPAHLKWDLWLGVAPFRPYNGKYCPFNWRGWWDFGTGALGDMACHTANLPFRALKLEYPEKIEAKCSGLNSQTYPSWSTIQFDFPKRGELPPIKFFWYDGGKKVPTELVEGLDLTNVRGGKKKKKVEKLSPGDIPGSGCLIVGEKSKLFSPDDYGSAFKTFPEVDYADVKETLPRVHGTDGHYKEWIDAIRGGPPAYSCFDFAALLTETILLGNIALRVGKPMQWDGPNMKSPNCPEAEKYVKIQYRQGYSL